MGKVLRYQHRPRPPQRRRQKPSGNLLGRVVFAVLVGAGIGWTAYLHIGPRVLGCEIKGNISVETGERIYHVPGQEYYLQTRIDPFRGERWFCTEQEAFAAGWRRSRVYALQFSAVWQ